MCNKLIFPNDIFYYLYQNLNGIMLTYNTILKELKDIPVNRLEELYDFVHSLNPKVKKSASLKKKILSFGGAFSDMSTKDFTDFVKETKKARTKLFDRNFDL
jgi:hypothetical protein